MTYILFFLIGLSGGSAQFATEDLCWKAGERLVKEFQEAPRVRWFCIQSGFKTQ
jgi:hypothetical protein